MTSSSKRESGPQQRRRLAMVLGAATAFLMTVAVGIGVGLVLNNRRSIAIPPYQWSQVHGLHEISAPITGTTDSLHTAVSPDGHTVAVGGNQTFRIWDTEHKRVVAVMEDKLLQRIDTLAFSGDGRLLAVAGWSSVVLFDVARHTRLASFTTQDCVGSVTFHPTEPLLVSSTCGTILIKKWVPPNLVDVKTLNIGSSDIIESSDDIAFSPDGRMLAAAEHIGGTVTIWDVGSWTKQFALNAAAKIWYEAFSPDGRLLAVSAGDMDHVVIWDVERHTVVSTLLGPGPATILPIAFSPDGRVLLTGGDSWLMVWDVQGRTWLAKQRTSRYVFDLTFSSDGRQLFASDGDLTVWEGIK
jgi:WD40 repeat protein